MSDERPSGLLIWIFAALTLASTLLLCPGLVLAEG